MYKLGITGGIGAGKSTACGYFAKMGAFVFNADKEAKKHLKKSITLQHRIIDAFGQDVVSNNKLSIKHLAEVAFSSKLEQNILNGLMWPEIFILVDNAMSPIQKIIPKSNEKMVEKWIRLALDIIVSRGITNIHDAWQDETTINVINKLINNNEFPIRCYGMLASNNKPLLNH